LITGATNIKGENANGLRQLQSEPPACAACGLDAPVCAPALGDQEVLLDCRGASFWQAVEQVAFESAKHERLGASGKPA